MGADYTNMLAKLQMQQAMQQQNSPSLFGLQAAPDPNATAALLKKLQDQQYIDQQGNDQGEFGWARNAGQKDFARLGQNIGNMLGVGTPAPIDNSAVMGQRAALQQGKSDYQQAIAVPGADPMQAQIDALTKLAANGVPGAAEALEKATDNAQKQAQSRAAVYKDTGQGAAAFDEIKNRAAQQAHQSFEEGGQTWHFVSEKDGVEKYVNENGEPKVVTTQPSKTLPMSAADQTSYQENAKKVAGYQMSLQDYLSRVSGPQRQQALQYVYDQNPDYIAGNYANSTAAHKVFTSGKLGDQARFTSNVAAHAQALLAAKQAINSGDVQKANQIAQAVGRQTGDPALASYDTLADIVSKEGVKVLVPGQSSDTDRQAAEARYKAALSGPALTSTVNTLLGAIGTQRNNLKNQYEKSTYRHDFDDIYPYPQTSLPGQGSATQQSGDKIVDFGSLK